MDTAAVVIDTWKLSIFESHLKDNGFAFTVVGNLTEDSLVIKVSYIDIELLKPVIAKAVAACTDDKRRMSLN